jgi:hypothetical protein
MRSRTQFLFYVVNNHTREVVSDGVPHRAIAEEALNQLKEPMRKLYSVRMLAGERVRGSTV